MLPWIRKRSILRVSQSEVKESFVHVNARVLNVFKIVYQLVAMQMASYSTRVRTIYLGLHFISILITFTQKTF